METKGGFYISQIKQLQERIFDKLLNEYNLDISGAQGRILFVLWQEDTLTMSEISRRTSLACNTLSSVIDRMVGKDIVQRHMDENNRRHIFISLTDYSRSLKEQYGKVSDKMADIFYKNFSPHDISAVDEKLSVILNNLKEYAAHDAEKKAHKNI